MHNVHLLKGAGRLRDDDVGVTVIQWPSVEAANAYYSVGGEWMTAVAAVSKAPPELTLVRPTRLADSLPVGRRPGDGRRLS